jgi:membrane protease YdiL (CAAX protease family)
MDEIESWPTPPKAALEERFRALLEVLLLSGLVSSFLAAIAFPLAAKERATLFQDAATMLTFVLVEALITFFLIGSILKIHSGSLRDLGLNWREWKPNLLIGIALVPLLFGINICVSTVFIHWLPQYAMDRNPLLEVIRTPRELALFLVAALIAGGIKEELQRVFILKRFQLYLGGARIGLILWSIAFGLGHYVQGAQGVVLAGLFGYIFGAIYLARENVIGPIVAHGLYDAITLVGYWLTRTIPQ